MNQASRIGAGAEMTDVGVERFAAGHGEEDGAEDQKPARADGGGKNCQACRRIDRGKDFWGAQDLAALQKALRAEPGTAS